MKSINVVKILEEEEKSKKKERKSIDEDTILKNKIWDFIDNFIMPRILKEIDLEEHYIVYYEDFLYETLEENSKQTESVKELYFEEEIDFLNKNNQKVKIDMANRYAEFCIKNYLKDEIVEDYYSKYAKPMLEKLNKENIIIFDKNSTDIKIKKTTDKIEKLVKKIIDDKRIENWLFIVYKNYYDFDYMEKNDVFFSNDNKDNKEKFCNCIKNYIVNNYDSIQYKKLKNLDNIYFADMDEFILD